MVDAVISFEGERGYPFRILRGAKNRFGATDEIGVFEMGDAGLREVLNPSALFLGEGGERAAGAAVFAGIEGSRPVLVEFQALVAPSAYGTPGGRWSVGIPGGWPWCWRCSRLAAGIGFGDARRLLERRRRPAHHASRRRTWRRRRPWRRRPWTRHCRRTAWCSAKSASRATCGQVGRMESRLKEAAKLGFGRAFGAVGGGGGGVLPGRRRAPGGRGRPDRPAGLGHAARQARATPQGRVPPQRHVPSMSFFDLAAGLALVVSGLIGWIRGGAREAAGMVALVLAAIVAFAALRFTGPIARHAIHTAWLAMSPRCWSFS